MKREHAIRISASTSLMVCARMLCAQGSVPSPPPPSTEAPDQAVEDAEFSREVSDPVAFDASDFLTGDWGGSRAALADSGLTFDLQWTQFAQGVVDGGKDTGWGYGATVDFLTTLDLGKMGVLPGGYVRVLAQGRYGNSVAADSGTSLPVNTDLTFPVTRKLDQDTLAITELTYRQFFSPEFCVFLGKLQTLDGDPNEFASGRGRSQFMNFNLVAPNLVGLAVPYSTLGAGVAFFPTERITVATTIMNRTDASTTSGFSDIGDGTTWATEAQFQYRLGDLPGGQNVGFAYSWDNDFLNYRKTRFTGDDINLESEDDTWTLFWSAWQYLITLDDPPSVIAAGDGRPDVRGLGLFARASVVDNDTNLVHWGASLGLGGRGLFPSRDEDQFGVGFAYVEFDDDAFAAPLLVDDNAYGMEAFYNAALAPGVSLTADIQVFQPAGRREDIDTTVLTGVRLNIRF